MCYSPLPVVVVYGVVFSPGLKRNQWKRKVQCKETSPALTTQTFSLTASSSGRFQFNCRSCVSPPVAASHGGEQAELTDGKGTLRMSDAFTDQRCTDCLVTTSDRRGLTQPRHSDNLECQCFLKHYTDVLFETPVGYLSHYSVYSVLYRHRLTFIRNHQS